MSYRNVVKTTFNQMMYSPAKLDAVGARTVYPLLWDRFYLSEVDADMFAYITGQTEFITNPSFLTGF